MKIIFTGGGGRFGQVFKRKTNLKNKVKEFLKVDLTIISSSGVIKLIID